MPCSYLQSRITSTFSGYKAKRASTVQTCSQRRNAPLEVRDSKSVSGTRSTERLRPAQLQCRSRRIHHTSNRPASYKIRGLQWQPVTNLGHSAPSQRETNVSQRLQYPTGSDSYKQLRHSIAHTHAEATAPRHYTEQCSTNSQNERRAASSHIAKLKRQQGNQTASIAVRSIAEIYNSGISQGTPQNVAPS